MKQPPYHVSAVIKVLQIDGAPPILHPLEFTVTADSFEQASEYAERRLKEMHRHTITAMRLEAAP